MEDANTNTPKYIIVSNSRLHTMYYNHRAALMNAFHLKHVPMVDIDKFPHWVWEKLERVYTVCGTDKEVDGMYLSGFDCFLCNFPQQGADEHM